MTDDDEIEIPYEARVAARDELLSLVERELCGPYSDDEVLTASPQNRYICGQLAPVRADEDLDDDAELRAEALVGATDSDVEISELAPEGDSGNDEQGVEVSSLTRARRDSLSSIGISFSIHPNETIMFSARWGEYHRDDQGRYCRTQRGAGGEFQLTGPCDLRRLDFGRVSIRWVARKTEDRLLVSTFFVNVTEGLAKDGTERIFQVGLDLAVKSSSGFLPRDDARHRSLALDVNDLLYADRREFGVGLHTAVQAEMASDGLTCTGLSTRTMPIAETRVTRQRNLSEHARALDMVALADGERADETCTLLAEFFLSYRKWMADLEEEVKRLPDRFVPHGQSQIIKIADRLRRIQIGLETLRTTPAAFSAFRFANDAMARAQFRSSRDAKSLPIGTAFNERDRSGKWRPFQLAFIISTIAEIVDPKLAERSVVDVLFFPTGGGKTEAYLGLAAFAMAFRRLSRVAPNHGAGISTLMRYTLRLLTTQQFNRAATMVCAAEIIRRERISLSESLGTVPFSIGLWVGPMTPNSYQRAVEIAKTLREEHRDCPRHCALSTSSREFPAKSLRSRDDGNLLPLTECPWCFKPLCIACVETDDEAHRIIVRCPNPACSFSGDDWTGVPSIKGLPLFLVDEDVYRISPSIVIGTVDKFATMPFVGQAKSLFGNVSRFCATCGFLTDASNHKKHQSGVGEAIPVPRNATLDLIIQDELHTITDNLGSIYGLYETAIEFLATRGEHPPKYVCATATVKDVERQVCSLYGWRSAQVFPPSGLVAGDTFFSADVSASMEASGRTYVGIYAPTFSRLSTFVAVLGAVLAASEWVAKNKGLPVADPYMTLLGYFNTVRDLGSVKALLGDDVPPLLEDIGTRNAWPVRKLFDWESELTGRISAAEVPLRLATLDAPFKDGVGCDFMAATNMISVGVDVPRLGLMLVDGQPKTTSEYIQATSRVGRSFPGIVLVGYNAMRPRDVSHYEHFFTYHDALYRFVEAGSVTPFSDGAVDRYLKAAIIAAYRMSSEHSRDEDASRYKGDTAARQILDVFRRRASAFGSHETNSAESGIDELDDRWRNSPKDLVYTVKAPMYPKKQSGKIPKEIRRALLTASDDDLDDSVKSLFKAARSMRNVEANVPLKIFVDG